MEIRNQEVDAKSDTETQFGCRYTLEKTKFTSFCTSYKSFQGMVRQEVKLGQGGSTREARREH